MKQAGSHFAAIMDLWNSHTGSHHSTELMLEQNSRDAQDAPNASFSWGWCNEVAVYGYTQSGQFADHVQIESTKPHADTMRGRDFTSAKNSNVEEAWNRWDMQADELPWGDVPVGAIVLLDTKGSHITSPNNWGSLGIDHVSTFLGLSDHEGYGWFLGGNQSGKMLAKEYELADVTFMSDFGDNGSYEDEVYYDWQSDDTIALDGDWSEETFTSMDNSQWKADSTTNSLETKWGKFHNASADEKLNIQKFRKDGTDEEIFIIGEQDVMIHEGHLIATDMKADVDKWHSIFEDIFSTSTDDTSDAIDGLAVYYANSDTVSYEMMNTYKYETTTEDFADVILDLTSNGDELNFSEMHRNDNGYWEARSNTNLDYLIDVRGGILNDGSWYGSQQEYVAVREIVEDASAEHEALSVDWAMSVATDLMDYGYTAVDIC